MAAGDVAAVPSPAGVRRLPLWHSGIEQAKTAAAALLRGEDAPVFDHRPYFWTEQFGLSLKAVGQLPFRGTPTRLDGDTGDDWALLRWDGPDGAATVAAINCRIAIPRLRRLCEATA